MPKLNFIPDYVIHHSEWCRIVNKSDKKTIEIDIDGIIGGSFWEEESADSKNTTVKMKAELKAISELKAETIIVNLNSPGGDVSHGLSIHDLLALHPAKVIVKISGMTASAATIIAMAGNEIQMSDNALFLVHRGMYGLMGGFNQNDLEAYTENLKTIDNKIVDIYHKRTGISVNKLNEIMDRDNGHGKWMDADEAKDAGFIDSIYEPMKAAALYVDPVMMKKFNLPEYNTDNQMKELFEDLKTFMSALFEKKEEGQEIEIPKELSDKITAFESSLTALSAENEQLKVDLQTEKDAKLAFEATASATESQLNERILALETDLNKSQAVSTIVDGLKGKEGEGISTPDPIMAEWDKLAAQMRKSATEFHKEDDAPDFNEKLAELQK